MRKIDINLYKRVFVLSDLHGYLNFFNLFFGSLKIDKDDLIIINGDSCDRGPDTYMLYKTVIDLIKSGFNIIHIKGNHEEMMYNSLVFSEDTELWDKNGGAITKKSYENISKPELELHLDFIDDMAQGIILDNYLITHAGINPTNDIYDQNLNDLIWMSPLFEFGDYYSKRIIYGHKINSNARINFKLNNTIAIDCGVYINKILGVLELPSEKEYYING